MIRRKTNPGVDCAEVLVGAMKGGFGLVVVGLTNVQKLRTKVPDL
jgi:hypothetical protein